MLDNHTKARKPSSWRSKPILSIRARLLVLALLAIAPLVFDRVHGLELARGHRIDRARAEVIDLARRGTESQREIIYSVRALLQIVARAYAKVPAEAANCNQYLTALTGNVPWIRGLSVAGADGRIKCSTESDVIGLNVSDRPHFQNALHSRDFALSDYLIHRVHQWPSLIATFPVIGDDDSRRRRRACGDQPAMGRRAGDDRHAALGRLGPPARRQRHAGRRLGRSGKPHRQAVRRAEPGARHARRATRARWRPKVLMASGVSSPMCACRGRKRASPSASTSAPCRPASTRETTVAYLQLALFSIFVLLVAWFGGEQLIVRPIRSLVRTATRIGRGDFHVRTTQETLDRGVRAACLRARRHGEEARRTRGGIAHRQRAPRGAGEPRRPDRTGQPPRLRPPARAGMAARRRDQRAGGADDDRYRSLQALQRPLRPRLGRYLPALGRRNTVAGDAGKRRARRPLWRRGIRAAAARPRSAADRLARRGGAPVDRGSPDHACRSAVRLCHHQHRRRVDSAAGRARPPPIWSRPRTARSMPPSGAAATAWTPMVRHW